MTKPYLDPELAELTLHQTWRPQHEGTLPCPDRQPRRRGHGGRGITHISERSWRCSPRARTPRPPRRSDDRCLRRTARGWGGYQDGVHADWAGTGQSLPPAASATGSATADTAVPTQGTHPGVEPSRAGRRPGRSEYRW